MRISDGSSDVSSSELDRRFTACKERWPSRPLILKGTEPRGFSSWPGAITPQSTGRIDSRIQCRSNIEKLPCAGGVHRIVPSLALRVCWPWPCQPRCTAECPQARCHRAEIGRAHVRNTITNAHIVCHHLSTEKKR